MKNRVFLIIISLFCITSINAQQLSSSAKVYLWTYAPDVPLYSSYGHDAIRIHDPQTSLNYIYNYGTFDAGTDNFYVKFAQGRLNYTISKIEINNNRVYKSFLARLGSIGKTITENEIQLDSTQRQAVFDYLENNARPENREYLYDFFFDNCATRVRDILVEVLDTNLHFGVPNVEGEAQTFRAMHKTYMAGKPWAEFGIDFLLGAKSDRIATPEERMYIPQEMYRTFKVSTITRNGEEIPLLGEDSYACKSDPIDVSESFWTSPLFVCWLVFALVLYYTVRTWNSESNRFDKFWFILMGILGLVVFLMWFATDHRVMVNNWNLLWLNPTYLIAAIALYSSAARKSWLPKYFKAVFVIILLTEMMYFLIPQYFHPGFFPLMSTIMFRAVYQIKKSGQLKS